MYHLILPHFGLGLGLGVVDSSLMPLLAQLVDERQGEDGVGVAYGSVYAISQTAVSLAYGFGPLVGGYLAEQVGFPTVMATAGVFNIIYSPILLFLKNTHQQAYRAVAK